MQMHISVIIPTLNRSQDLKKCLDSIFSHGHVSLDIIVVDQSSTQETKDLCSHYSGIRHCFFSVASLAQARNFGLQQLSKDTNIVVFLDDDTTLAADFFVRVQEFFAHHPHAKGGVANIQSPLRKISFLKKLGIFLLTGRIHFSETVVTSGGFNIMPFIQPTTLKHVERTSGCGMFFRKELFDEGFRFDDRFMRYSLMEDCFFSYAVFKKYPHGLFFVPTVSLVHHETPIARIPNKAKIFQNIVHRFYFIQKFKKNELAYVWTMLIFCFFDLLTYKNIRIIKWYMVGLRYVFTNKKNILKSDFNFNTFIFG